MTAAVASPLGGTALSEISKPEVSRQYQQWEPLPKILYGSAIAPFAPEADSLSLPADADKDVESALAVIQPHLIGLEVGDEVYVFEQLGHNDVQWYRGYVVSTNRVPVSATTTSSLSDYSAFASTSSAGAALVEEPQVYVGIFPRAHVYTREELDDAESRLADVYARALENGAIGATGLPVPKVMLSSAPMETLPEEDETASSVATTPHNVELKIPNADDDHSRTAPSTSAKLSPAKVSFNAQRQSFVLQEQNADEERPPPPLPSLKCGDETTSGTTEPIVDEIACALREWSTLMYTYLSRREYSRFQTVREHIDALHVARRQLMTQTLSEEESAKLRRECVARLVCGNVQQGLDVIVRHPGRGGLVDVDFAGKGANADSWISGIHLYALQTALAYMDQDGSENVAAHFIDPWGSGQAAAGSLSSQASISLFNGTSTLTNANRRALGRQNSLVGGRVDAGPKTPSRAWNEPVTDIKYFHVFLEVRKLVSAFCLPDETAELYFSLYNRAESRFLTEEFCVILNHEGLPLRGDDKMRALFTDLSVNDMHDLNVVCRIVRQGAMKLSTTDVQRSTNDDTQLHGHHRTASLEDGHVEDVPGFRTSRMTSSRSFRRPFGCAVVELGQEHSIQIDTESSSTLRDHVMPIFVAANESAFSTLHQDIIASRVRQIEKSPRADLINISVKVFHGEKTALIRDNPALLEHAALAARLGFPDVVFPGDTRNEVYIKLWSAEFFPQGGKVSVGTTQKSVQVSIEVRTREGNVIEHAISRGAGEAPVSQYDSLVFYHQNTPTWGELLKLQLPNEVMEGCHLFFTFRYRTAKEERAILSSPTHSNTGFVSSSAAAQIFAHAYLPLFASNESFINDGSHTLLLWRNSRPAQSLGPQLYFTLPATVPMNDGLHDVIPSSLTTVIQPLRDTMTLRTFLVSARYTQNEILLRLMNWESIPADDQEGIKDTLVKFAFVGEVETVKFLRGIFDALFGILASPKNGSGELDDLIFNSLVTVLGIIQDRRFNNFRATVDIYIDQHYHSQTVHSRLISSMARLLADPVRSETSKELRASIKVWPYLFRFIIRSRENQRGGKSPLTAPGGAVSDHLETAFRNDIDSLLRSVNRLMATSKPSSIIGTQTLALQYFAGILPELARVVTIDELARIETAFADSVFAKNGRMAVWKLLHILHVARDSIMDNHAARSQMLPSFIRWIRPHIGRYDENANVSVSDHDSARDSARIIWVEGARISVTIIAILLDKLQVNIMNCRRGARAQNELRQEQDNVDYMLSLLSRLLETYTELQSAPTRGAMERHRSPSTVSADVPIIFPSSYPFPLVAKKPKSQGSASTKLTSRRIAQADRSDLLNCGLGEIAAVISVLVMLSPKRHISGFLDEQLDVDGREHQTQLLQNFFDVASSILRNEAFPSTWLNVNILMHQMILKMADPVASLLIRDYIPTAEKSEEFGTELWRSGLEMLLTLLSSEQLIIERFKPQRRRAVWNLAGDIRGEGAHIFAKLWNSIGWPDQQDENRATNGVDFARLNTGGFQVQFVPSLVEPVLELCLSHHDELRTCAVRVLATMITSEWHLNGNFAVIEAEIIDKLDVLFITNTHGDDISRAFFIGQLRSLFESPQVDPRLQEQVHGCLVSVNRFLDLLLSVRSLPAEEGFEDDRVSGTLKLLGFLRQANRVSAFSTHVLRLVNLHLENQNYVEAALTLKLHADLHSWAVDDFVEPVADLDLPRQSHFARKETLYMLILDYLNKGQAWEISIDVCRELAREYEYRAYDYSRLADVLVLQASLFQKIATEERVFPSYFRVAYYGSQWPSTLQDKSFVYRGNTWEKFSNFCERMHQRHPRATLIKSSMEPNDEIRSAYNMYLQITAIQPEPDRTRSVFVDSATPPIIRAYYEHNTTNHFSFTRPVTQGSADGEKADAEQHLTSLWVEKTFLRAEDSFPTVLRRSEVASVEVVQISPIENALADIDNKTGELETLEMKFKSLSKLVGSNVSLNTNRLSMALNGAVDAPVNGGIPMYRRTFLTEAYAAAHPDDEPLLEKLKVAIEQQTAVIYRCIVLHSRLCPMEMRPFHESLERFFQQNFAEEIDHLQLDMDSLSDAAADDFDLDDARTLHQSADQLTPHSQHSQNNLHRATEGHKHDDTIVAGRAAPASAISPLQRHIAYLSAQSQPISTSPAAFESSLARNGSLLGNDAASVVQRTPTLRSIAGHTSATALPQSPVLSASMLSSPQMPSISKTMTSNATMQGMSPIHTLAEEQSRGNGSVDEVKTVTRKRESSLLARVTESRASRLFSSRGKR